VGLKLYIRNNRSLTDHLERRKLRTSIHVYFFPSHTSRVGSHDSSVGIVTGLRSGELRIRGSIRARDFYVECRPVLVSVPGFLSLGIKRSGRKADLSPTSNAKAKNEWSCTNTPPYGAMACIGTPLAFNSTHRKPRLNGWHSFLFGMIGFQILERIGPS
jgi:hypothetical protein